MYNIIISLSFIFFHFHSAAQLVGTNGPNINYSANANVDASGESAINLVGQLPVDWSFLASNTVFSGGNGGNLIGSDGRELNAVGGRAVLGQQIGSPIESYPEIVFDNDGIFTGGSGGNVTNLSSLVQNGTIEAKGSESLLLITLNNDINIQNGTFIAGNGGMVSNESTSSGFIVENIDARGGNAISIVNPSPQNFTADSLKISGGTFTGGNGGNIASPDGGLASGGNGLYIQGLNNVVIDGGLFVGGLSGEINGQDGDIGAGISVLDSSIEINGGSFFGSLGLSSRATDTSSNNISINSNETIIENAELSGTHVVQINSGNFGNLKLLDVHDVDINISGGVITNLVSEGTGILNFNSSINTELESINIEGDSVNSFSFGNGATGPISINIENGVTDFNQWNDDQLLNTIISGGSVSFNDQDFNLVDKANLSLSSSDSSIQFNGSNTTIRTGATLDLGSGILSANNFTTESGSIIKTSFYENENGYANGLLNVDTLNINPNTILNISNIVDDLDINLIPENRFLIAVSTNNLNNLNQSEISNINLEGFEWIYDITGFSTGEINGVHNLYANAGVTIDNLVEQMNASGDLSILLNELEINEQILGTNLTSVLQNKDNYADLAQVFYRNTALETANNLNQSFFRSAEIGNVLINSQSLLSDQIKGRIMDHSHSHISSVSMPNGPINWFHSSGKNAPFGESWISSRNRTNKLPLILNSDVPSELNTWGRAFVSDLQQNSTVGFAGYDAYISGGIVGIDKRTNRSLIGIAGGINKTTINGLDGHDGDIESLHGTVYLSHFYDNFCLNAHLILMNNDIESINGISGYSADYNAKNISSFIGLSTTYEIFDGAIKVYPELSLLSTKFYHNEYDSSSSLGIADMKFDSYKFWSHKSELGVIALPSKIIDSESLEMAFQPEFRLHWVHDFNTELNNETYHFIGSNQKYKIELQHREKNLTRLGSGIKCWDWRNQSTVMGLDLDYFKGDIYSEWMFSGHLLHRF